jgi:hypothetical protein
MGGRLRSPATALVDVASANLPAGSTGAMGFWLLVSAKKVHKLLVNSTGIQQTSTNNTNVVESWIRPMVKFSSTE